MGTEEASQTEETETEAASDSGQISEPDKTEQGSGQAGKDDDSISSDEQKLEDEEASQTAEEGKDLSSQSDYDSSVEDLLEASAPEEQIITNDNNDSGQTSSENGNTSNHETETSSQSGKDTGNQAGNTYGNQPESSDNKDTSPSQTETTQSPEAEGTYLCTISIYCDTILKNMDLLNPSKTSSVPSNGCILQTETVEFTPGDTVFDVLQRVTKENGIQMEYSYTAIYGSMYIEGINNLYEFDCGELSGWMYSVNGVFPGFGCSKYVLKNNDVIKWVYTCDLGDDVGNPY